MTVRLLRIAITSTVWHRNTSDRLEVTVGRPTTQREDMVVDDQSTASGYAGPCATFSPRGQLASGNLGNRGRWNALPPEAMRSSYGRCSERRSVFRNRRLRPACVAVGDLPRPTGSGAGVNAELRRFEICSPRSLRSLHLGRRTQSRRGARCRCRSSESDTEAGFRNSRDLPGTRDRLVGALINRGFEARLLDSAALEATRTDAEGRSLLARIGVAVSR